ncbi:type II toxin-antitoxin system RelE/ParE family toxin [Beijerinckia sp. L45]|uniref:type II toxin-antitoxin system RelE/ParE family toxin n=1 Tax=Beijerinckia sp. L45 TaxID=1641855 RepID=UPI001FEE2C51|nr:type II toxin-antitoxin system RelE/ParE family toxin [Beijerinckia sp. L45]
MLGRSRPELRPDFRSVAFETYLIFFRYRDGATPRDVLEVIRVLHGARDIEALFDRDSEAPL